MSSAEDDVLRVSDPDESDFSGFESNDLRISEMMAVPSVAAEEVVETAKDIQPSISSKVLSVSTKQKDKKDKKDKKKKKVSKTKSKNVVDLNNLSSEDIEKLRKTLGLSEPQTDFDPNNVAEIHVEVDSNDIDLSDNENLPPKRKKANDETRSAVTMSNKNLLDAMFGSHDNEEDESEDEWGLPKLKSVEKDKPIAQSLASLINTSCTSQVDTDSLVTKYRVPENCDKLVPPLVNNEVWKVLDKRARSYDRAFVDIQNLVAAGMVPVIKLAEILKPYIVKNDSAKQMLSDVLMLMGQIQYNLSLRRRYLIRPNLKKKYSNLCNVNVPITTSLFGDDVSKEIKNCETGISLAKDRYGYDQKFRGRGAWRGGRGGNGRGGYRYQPYGRGQTNQNHGGYNQRGNYSRGRGRNASATVTSAPPNDQ